MSAEARKFKTAIEFKDLRATKGTVTHQRTGCTVPFPRSFRSLTADSNGTSQRLIGFARRHVPLGRYPKDGRQIFRSGHSERVALSPTDPRK